MMRKGLIIIIMKLFCSVEDFSGGRFTRRSAFFKIIPERGGIYIHKLICTLIYFLLLLLHVHCCTKAGANGETKQQQNLRSS